MATRTFKLAGTTQGSSTITVNFNGTQVFTGAVGTDGDLCSFTADDSLSGSMTTVVTVDSGDNISVHGIKANYVSLALTNEIDNGDGTTTPAVFTTNDADNFYFMPGTDGVIASASAVSNASIDGESIDLTDTENTGIHQFTVSNGETLSADYNIIAV